MDGIYRYYPKESNGYSLMFRQNTVTGAIQVKVTDDFAKTQGFKGGLEELSQKTKDHFKDDNIKIAEWITVDSDDLFARMN